LHAYFGIMAKKYCIYCLFVLLACVSMSARADDRPYLCEVGIQGGFGYYVGDATPHICMNIREAYGVQFRYKFTKRWAVQAKVSGQRLVGNDYTIRGEKLDTKWQNRIINVDVMAEFNFFRFGSTNPYDKRIRCYTPYIFLGIGTGIHGTNAKNDPKFNKATAYIPLGIGFKWKFHDLVGMNIAWQHNIYMTDCLESRGELNNKHKLNGWNWMNCDLTGMFTVGIVFEFAKAKKQCRICNW